MVSDRDEELQTTPLRQPHPEAWPSDVRQIAFGEMAMLGIDTEAFCTGTAIPLLPRSG